MVKRPKKKGAQASQFDLERATAALGKLPTEAARHKIDPRRSFVESNRDRFEQLLANGWTVSRIRESARRRRCRSSATAGARIAAH